MLVTKSTDVETEDGRISNREAAEKIKDAWMYKQIHARRDEFTHYRQVCIALHCIVVVACLSSYLQERPNLPLPCFSFNFTATFSPLCSVE